VWTEFICPRMGPVVVSCKRDNELLRFIKREEFSLLYLSLSITIQSFVGPWQLFQFLNPIYRR
jgi:hypothetical protein